MGAYTKVVVAVALLLRRLEFGDFEFLQQPATNVSPHTTTVHVNVMGGCGGHEVGRSPRKAARGSRDTNGGGTAGVCEEKGTLPSLLSLDPSTRGVTHFLENGPQNARSVSCHCGRRRNGCGRGAAAGAATESVSTTRLFARNPVPANFRHAGLRYWEIRGGGVGRRARKHLSELNRRLLHEQVVRRLLLHQLGALSRHVVPHRQIDLIHFPTFFVLILSTVCELGGLAALAHLARFP